jgi:glucokinase
MNNFAIALDLGGTQVRAALVDRHGHVHNRVSAPTGTAHGPDVILRQLRDAALAMTNGVPSDSILGVGVSAPGPLNAAEGISLSMPTIHGFENVSLRTPLEQALGLPVWFENDASAAALGEWRFGAGMGLHNFVYITVSTGIGGGVVIDNRLMRGRLGLAAEVGHMTILRNGETCACGNRGCWEAYASGTAFLRRARARVQEPVKERAQRTSLLTNKPTPLHGQAVFDAAAQGDALAIELVAEEAEFLGIGIANLLHLYSPEVIVVGGGMSTHLEVLRPGICAKVRQAAMKGFEDIPIVRATLDGNSGLVGAAALVFDAFPAASQFGLRLA